MMSSEEALNQIFNILQTTITIQNEEKKKSQEIKADKAIIDLLNGVVENAKKNEAAGTVGQQLEALSKGIKSFQDIDNNKQKY